MMISLNVFVAVAAELRQVAVFCLAHGARCYPGCPPDRVFRYLAFQRLTGGLVVCRQGPDIEGVLIAWPTTTAETLRRAAAGEFHFNWRPPAPGGDALMIADVISLRRRDSVFRLLQMASARWPDWKMRRLFTHRSGRLVEIAPRLAERFFAHVAT